jgi:hypothetical protein
MGDLQEDLRKVAIITGSSVSLNPDSSTQAAPH